MVESINLHEGYALLESGEIVAIERMFDADGDDTDEPDIACAAVAPMRDGRWLSIDLTQFEPARVH